MYELVENIDIHDSEHDEKGSRDGCTDDSARGTKCVELIADCSGCSCDYDARDNDDPAKSIADIERIYIDTRPVNQCKFVQLRSWLR